jgi:hypothetical protein
VQNARLGCLLGVYAKSAIVLVAAGLASIVLNRSLNPAVHDSTLRIAVAFSIVQISSTAGMALFLLAQRSYAQFHKSVCDQLRPAIQEHVTALAFSGQTWPGPVPRRGPARHVLEECLATSLLGLRDSGRIRLADFVWQQGFAKQWQKVFSSRSVNERKQAIAMLSLVSKAGSDAVTRRLLQDAWRNALQDKEPAIRTEAARALLAAGETDTVFRSVLGESLLVRVLLTADLKRHARSLLATTIPAMLAEPGHTGVLNCLQMLAAWKLAIPGLDITPLLHHNQDRRSLPLIIALLPYASSGETSSGENMPGENMPGANMAGERIEDWLVAALEMPDIDVRCAAARTAGQLKLNRLTPALLRLLSQNARLAIASATALAQMGPEGERGLQAVVAGPDRKAAAAALEALETLAVGTQ